MTKHHTNNPIFTLLLILIFFTSCNGQVKNQPLKNVNGPKSISNEQPKMIKSQGTYTYNTGTGPHSDTNVSISSILEDKNEYIWLTTMGEGVYRYDGSTFKNFTVKEGLMANVVYSILEDKEGNIWFGTINGASRYDGQHFTDYPFSVIQSSSLSLGFESSYFSNKEIWSMLLDRKGNIWFGTTEGVYRYDGTTFRNILEIDTSKTNKNLRLFAIPSLIEDKAGNIWFTSWSEGLCRFDGARITVFKSEGRSLSNKGLLQDKNGNIWIAKRGSGGVGRYDGKTFTSLFPGLIITAMKEDEAGNIWFGTYDREKNSGGVVLYNPSTAEIISKFTTREGLSNNRVSSLTIDKSGEVWFGTHNMSLSRYDGNTFTNFFSE